MKKIKLIGLVIAALIAVFIGIWVVQDNALEIGIVLLGFPLLELPIGLWVLVFFLTGVAAGVCLCYPTIFALQRRSRATIKRLQKMDAELSAARAQPTTE
ncbi:MAG: LapA family protein [Porticoccaceae bacterium]|nr:LapA family protein [Porticoccaceae bacterium]